MIVEVDVRARPGLPPVVGPHELSWSYILDAVFADAFTQRLARLELTVPTTELAEQVRARAELTPDAEGAKGVGVARLDGSPLVELKSDGSAARLYGLGVGYFRRFAGNDAPAPRWQLVQQVDVMTLTSRLQGLPIRLAALARRPGWSDVASFRMRRDFADPNAALAYYHLSFWAPAIDG